MTRWIPRAVAAGALLAASVGLGAPARAADSMVSVLPGVPARSWTSTRTANPC